MIIFLLPLALAIAATIYFLISEDIGLVGKIIAVALTGGSILLTFVPALQTHFLVPLAMQMIVCLWLALYWKMQG
jgi:hypothetical protein